MDYNRFLKPTKEGDMVYLLRKIHEHATSTKDGISLASGTPNPDTVPIVGVTFKCADGTELEVDADTTRNIMQYQSADGMTRLLDWINRIQQKYHHPPIMTNYNDDNQFSACVVPGAMGGMHNLFAVTLEENDVVLADEFIFGGSICCFKRAGAFVLGVKMDNHGVVPEALQDALENWKTKVSEQGASNPDKLNPPKMFYTIPCGQNPTGVVVPEERKRQIYKVAQKYDILIVEDDPYYYLQYTEVFSPSYQAIDVDGRVIRLDSMSKFIAPGIRLGWLSGPSKVVKAAAEAQTTNTIAVGCLAQIAVIKLFDSWGLDGFDKRIKELVKFYQPLKNVAEQAIEKHLSEFIEWIKPVGGIFIWCKLKHCDDSLFLADVDFCEKYGVYAVPGIDFSFSSKSGPYLRICFSNVPPDTLKEGIRRMGRLLKDAVESSKSDAS